MKTGLFCIEGNPFITRFKTQKRGMDGVRSFLTSIEGNPFITRFKTQYDVMSYNTNTL